MDSDRVRRVRPAACAGAFYPADANELRSCVRALLGQAAPDSESPLALIVPHAGYAYSGPIAASAYACLAGVAPRVRRVLLLGPAHFVAVDGVAASTAEVFETPLGPVPVDRAAVDALMAAGLAQVHDRAHSREHSVETQLPFLQCALGEIEIIPLVTFDAAPETVADVIETAWADDATLVVVSSDLSHGLDHRTAADVDRTTAEAIEALHDDLPPDRVCGAAGVNGLMRAARRRGLRARCLDLRSSGDTTGATHRVVGYGAFAIER